MLIMKCHIPSEAERLEKYFAILTKDFPYIRSKEIEEAITRPCKWGSKQGKQFVPNTEAAKKASKKARTPKKK